MELLKTHLAEGRRLPSWTASFVDYTSILPSPEIFRKWSAIAAIAGALERKVWTRPFGPNLYPNLYVCLVAPPGIGKTVITSQVGMLWNELPDHHIAPSSVTAASLIDALSDSRRTILRPGETPGFVEFNSLQVNSNELGVLLPAYDSELMNSLTDIYDGHPYAQRRRGKDLKIQIKAPQINILAATTPAYLMSAMPAGAWDQGFLSRMILIYSGESIIRPLFATTEADKVLNENLIHDLKHISRLYGQVQFSADAAKRITEWHLAGGPPKPEHPRLQNYSTRRTSHLLKLCMIASASLRDDLVVDETCYELALDWLIEAELMMPDIFKAMATGGDAKAIEDTYYFTYQLHTKTKAPIPEHRIIAFLQERVPAHSVIRVMELMVRGRLLREQLQSDGAKGYVPLGKRLG